MFPAALSPVTVPYRIMMVEVMALQNTAQLEAVVVGGHGRPFIHR